MHSVVKNDCRKSRLVFSDKTQCLDEQQKKEDDREITAKLKQRFNIQPVTHRQ